MAREFPDYEPYPFGRRDHVNLLVRHILLAQPLTDQYGRLLADLDDDGLVAMANSFAVAHCARREPLIALLAEDLKTPFGGV
jgi:hypothetical protein